MLLELFVQPCVAAGEDELRVALKQVDDSSTSGQRFYYAGGPPPQPDRIDVGITDHMYSNHGEDTN